VGVVFDFDWTRPFILEFPKATPWATEPGTFFIFFMAGITRINADKLWRLKPAVADLGRPEGIGRAFAGFQKYLYQEIAR